MLKLISSCFLIAPRQSLLNTLDAWMALHCSSSVPIATSTKAPEGKRYTWSSKHHQNRSFPLKNQHRIPLLGVLLPANLSLPAEFHTETAHGYRNQSSMRWIFILFYNYICKSIAKSVCGASQQSTLSMAKVLPQTWPPQDTHCMCPALLLHVGAMGFRATDTTAPWMLFWSPVTSGMQLWDPWASWESQHSFCKGDSLTPRAKLTKLSSEVAQAM